MCACAPVLPQTGGPGQAQTTPMTHTSANRAHRQVCHHSPVEIGFCSLARLLLIPLPLVVSFCAGRVAGGASCCGLVFLLATDSLLSTIITFGASLLFGDDGLRGGEGEGGRGLCAALSACQVQSSPFFL